HHAPDHQAVGVTMRAIHSRPLTAILVAVFLSPGCSEFIRQDRSPVTLVIDKLEGGAGSKTAPKFGGFLNSDVITKEGVFADFGQAAFRIIMKDVPTSPSPINAVTVDRYRVSF